MVFKRRKAGLVAAVVFALAVSSVPAQAACGGVNIAYPKRNVSRGPAPLAIGDSSMLLALPDLAKRGFKANARGCRQMPEGLAVMRKAKRHKALPKLVVLALGADGSVSMAQIRTALQMLGRRKKLGLVTPLESGGGTGHDAEVVREAAERYDRQVRLLDWPNFSNGHPGWFQPDGLHLTFPGASAFARLLGKALSNLPPPK